MQGRRTVTESILGLSAASLQFYAQPIPIMKCTFVGRERDDLGEHRVTMATKHLKKSYDALIEKIALELKTELASAGIDANDASKSGNYLLALYKEVDYLPVSLCNRVFERILSV
jgi:hypothetical protein